MGGPGDKLPGLGGVRFRWLGVGDGTSSVSKDESSSDFVSMGWRITSIGLSILYCVTSTFGKREKEANVGLFGLEADKFWTQDEASVKEGRTLGSDTVSNRK